MALWLREEEIFGSTRFPSPVQVNVTLDPKTPPTFAEAENVQRGKYALFALQPGDQLLCEDLKFQLSVSWLPLNQLTRQRKVLNALLAKAKQPALPDDVEDITDDLQDAIWAWANFGGLGGRTRRGCGSLLGKEVDDKGNVRLELAPNSVAEIDEWFRSAQQRFGRPAGSPAQWPHLGERLVYRPEAEPPVPAWLRLTELFREFRQGKIGRNHSRQGGRPGRSHFPEPETIRETIRNRGKRGGTHAPLDKVPADAFPRAEFGLPIVFQFQHNEVDQTVLYPRIGKEQPERMASPLVLKPLCLANGTAVPAFIPLDVPWFTDVELTLRGRDKVQRTFPLSAVRRPDLATYPNSPLANSPAGSAIEAFLAFAQNADNGFREATR
jgi:CRISPR-associated protein Cmr1